jgi:hypothetical protein
MTTPSQLKSFHRATLNDNWYEERAKPLKGVIADYGVRSFGTTAKNDFRKPTNVEGHTGRSRAEKQKQIAAMRSNWPNTGLTMVNIETFPAVSQVRTTADQPENGFDALLPSHGANQEERYLKTMSQDTFGVGKKTTRTQARRVKKPDAAQAGGPGGGREEKGTSTSGMAGEIFKTQAEPQHNTAAQRSWMYANDAGITVRTSAPVAARSAMGLSLPIGEATIANKAAPRVSTTLTKGSGGVFMDDER